MGGTSTGPAGKPGARPRPAAAAKARPAAAAASGKRPSPVRLISLLGVTILLAIMIVPTLRAYIAQREEHARLLATVEEQHRDVENLSRQLNRLRDPAYKEQLARQRLHMVRPGETPFGVIRPGENPAVPAPSGGDGATPTLAQTAAPSPPWYVSVMSRLQRVDEGRSTPTATMVPGNLHDGEPTPPAAPAPSVPPPPASPSP